MSEVATPQSIAAKAQSIFRANNALSLATTGGPYSPWVLGVYFVSDGLTLYTLLEQSGKTMANVRANPHVSFMISENDAQKDFLQGTGELVLLPSEQEAVVRARLLAKLPWYQTFTPVVPVRINTKEIFVSSLTAGWFPAKKLSA